MENFVDYSVIWEKLSLVSCWADSDSYEIFIKLKKKLITSSLQQIYGFVL